MDKLDLQEKIWGFIFGIIAIIAACLEVVVNGISAATILGAIKDVFGTAVVIVVFYMVIKSLPKKPKKLTEILEKTILDWGLDNAPLIFKTKGYVSSKDSPYTQGYVLLQNLETYPSLAGLTPDKPNWDDYATYKSPKKLTGKFLDMPDFQTMTNSDFDVLFVIEQSHFQGMNMDVMIGSIKNAVEKKYNGEIVVDRKGQSAKFTVRYKQITNLNEVENFKDSLDFILSLIKVIA